MIALSRDDALKSLQRDLGLGSLWMFLKRARQAEVPPVGLHGWREDHIYQKLHSTDFVIVSSIKSFF